MLGFSFLFWSWLYLIHYPISIVFQVAQVCTNCGVNMGEYFCEICKFFDDDVILPSEIDFSALVYWILILYCQNIRFFIAIELPLLPSYYLVVIWFLMYGTCLTFVVDANLIWLHSLQTAKGQFHCDDCGICRWVSLFDQFILFLSSEKLFKEVTRLNFCVCSSSKTELVVAKIIFTARSVVCIHYLLALLFPTVGISSPQHAIGYHVWYFFPCWYAHKHITFTKTICLQTSLLYLCWCKLFVKSFDFRLSIDYMDMVLKLSVFHFQILNTNYVWQVCRFLLCNISSW